MAIIEDEENEKQKKVSKFEFGYDEINKIQKIIKNSSNQNCFSLSSRRRRKTTNSISITLDELQKILQDFNTENSFLIFSKKNQFRILCLRITKLKAYDNLVIGFIILSTIKLAMETFYNKKDPSVSFKFVTISQILSFSINIFFSFVILIKSIAMGFIIEKKTFCRDKLNLVNLIAVVGFYLNLIWKNQKNLNTFFTVT